MINKIRNLFIAASAVAFLSTAAFAQAPTAARPAATAPQTAAASGETKFAVVYTEQFLDPKGGINRLISANASLNREFEPRGAELQTMSQNRDKILKQIQDTRAVADQATLIRLQEQAEGIEVEIKRKSEDAQRSLAKRQGELMNPLQTNINNALVEFAKQRGYTAVMNGSQLAGVLILIDNKIDITDAFIADYNAKNPATAAAVTTPARR